MNGELPTLAPTWVWSKLSDIVEINPPVDYSGLKDQALVTFVPMSAVDEHSGTISSPEIQTFEEARKGHTRFVENDVIFARITPCMENGKIAIARNLKNGLGFGSTEFYVLRPREGILSEFIYYYLRQESFRNFMAQHMTSTVGQLRVPRRVLGDVEFPLAPTREQKLITSKISELLVELQIAKQVVEKIPSMMKQFRQSVLTHAFRGSLVPDIGNEESINKLILDFKSQKESGEQRRVKHSTRPDDESELDGLPEMPDGWTWIKIDYVVDIIDYRGRTPPYSDRGIPHIRSSNIDQGQINWANIKYVSEETFKKYMTRGLPKDGDLLFTTEAPLGEVAPVPNMKFSLAQRVIILRPLQGLDSKFLQYQIMSEDFQDRIRRIKSGTTVTGISSRNLKPIRICVTSHSIQKSIVKKIEELFSLADKIESLVNEARIRVSVLDQAIFSKAYRGELVPQDPNDEPASVLLEKIGTSQKTRK